jgi:hypothetical protein
MRTMTWLRAALLGGFFVLSATACNPIDEIDMAVDCTDLCNRYRDCFDASYDTASCRDRCHDVVDRDPDAADACDACLDARSCTGAFACADECYGLVP